MGRYTTVQAYADKSPSMRSVSYDQATAATGNNEFVRPEKVENPYGSTAGAGSGNFHVYRHSRARETDRLKQMDESEKEQMDEAEFQELVRKNQTGEELKTEKRRKKREREKEAKRRKKHLKLSGIVSKENISDAVDEEEFRYVSVYNKEKLDNVADNEEILEIPLPEKAEKS